MHQEDSCLHAQQLRRAAASSAPAGKRSKLPTLDEWNAVGEVTVSGASALGCEAKMVREWLRVSCRGASGSGGKPSSARLTQGGRTDTYTYAGYGVASLVTPFVAGVHLEAEYGWTDMTRSLVVDWPAGAPKPSVVGAFAGAGP
jgi:hypothetical protein